MVYLINKKWLLVMVILLSTWLLGIILAPVLASSTIFWQNQIAKIIYFIYQPVCHQFPERSFLINKFPFAVCVRCFAVYLSGLLLAIYYLFKESITMLKLSTYGILSIFPVIDFILEKFNMYHNLMILRFITGMLLGYVLFHMLIAGISDVRE